MNALLFPSGPIFWTGTKGTLLLGKLALDQKLDNRQVRIRVKALHKSMSPMRVQGTPRTLSPSPAPAPDLQGLAGT